MAEGPTARTSGAVRIELAGDDDEAIMKAKREADAIEKRCVPSLLSSQLPLTPRPPQRCEPTSLLDRPIHRLWGSQHSPP